MPPRAMKRISSKRPASTVPGAKTGPQGPGGVRRRVSWKGRTELSAGSGSDHGDIARLLLSPGSGVGEVSRSSRPANGSLCRRSGSGRAGGGEEPPGASQRHRAGQVEALGLVDPEAKERLQLV